jgi:hypothetical protein
MSSQRCIALVTVAFALVFSANVSTARGQQKLLTADQTQIVNTVSTIFTAARADDVAKFDSVIASDFYIYDGGVRFNGDAVMAVIKAQHAAGKRFEWNVTEPDVHIIGNTAWICIRQSRQHHRRLRHPEPEMARIGLSPETGRHLEDRLHAQHARRCSASRESREIT